MFVDIRNISGLYLHNSISIIISSAVMGLSGSLLADQRANIDNFFLMICKKSFTVYEDANKLSSHHSSVGL